MRIAEPEAVPSRAVDTDVTWPVLDPAIGLELSADVTRSFLEPVIGPIPKSMSTSAIPDRRVSE